MFKWGVTSIEQFSAMKNMYNLIQFGLCSRLQSIYKGSKRHKCIKHLYGKYAWHVTAILNISLVFRHHDSASAQFDGRKSCIYIENHHNGQ